MDDLRVIGIAPLGFCPMSFIPRLLDFFKAVFFTVNFNHFARTAFFFFANVNTADFKEHISVEVGKLLNKCTFFILMLRTKTFEMPLCIRRISDNRPLCGKFRCRSFLGPSCRFL